MTGNALIRLVATTVLSGTLLVGCAGGPGSRPETFARAAQNQGPSKDLTKALARAEQAVAENPVSAASRVTLAEAYLANGRFQSAQQSYADAYELGDRSAKTIVNLAMMDVALGRDAAARDLLDANKAVIPATDFGLAVALAGSTEEGVAVLIDSIREGENTAKVRQNLALAYALDGRWREAEIMVSQDLAPAVAKARIEQWAREAHPLARTTRVASLFRVVPQVDAGQPQHLALAKQQEQLALAPAEEAMKPVESASIDNSARLGTFDAEPKAAAVLAPVTQPSGAPAPVAALRAPTAVVAAPIETAAIKPSGVKVAALNVAPKAAMTGGYSIQLGAFSQPGNVDRAWALYSRRHGELANYARKDDPIKLKSGTVLHRLVVSGFEDMSKARSICSQVRSAGGECLVRGGFERPAVRGAGPMLAARR